MITAARLDSTLKTLKLIVDSREHKTESLTERLEAARLPFVRRKLDFGDYSAEVTLDNGSVCSLENRAVVERKMSIDELAMCYGAQRERFEAEFIRAKEAGAFTYLLIEGGSFEKILRGEYTSLYNPKALLASVDAWIARYRCQIVFCEPETTGLLLRDFMYREAREMLKEVYAND